MLKEKQIVGILDVQLNTPNMSATESNFGNRQLSMRGVSNMVDLFNAQDAAVSYHVNEIPLRDPPLNGFYDIERVEILRGPQGTLYGRNSTAGAINAMTKRPRFEGFDGYVDLEIGNYDLIRTTAAVELTLSDQFAVRVAGYKLDRDGYINNLAQGQVPNVDGDLDGRDVYSFRITPEWRISDRTTVWAIYEQTREDDDRVRISNQICKTNPLPTTACDPDAFGLEAPNVSAQGWAFWSGLFGLHPLGARDAATGLTF